MAKRQTKLSASDRAATFLAALTPRADTAGIRVVSIDVPLAAIDPAGRLGAHVDVRLSHGQAKALRAVYNSLIRTHAVLAGGRKVANPNDAVRWLLEQVESKT